MVDRNELKQLQAAGDVLGAHALLRDAYETDVRPVLAELREEIGRPADPLKAYRADDIILARRAWRESNPARAAGGGLGA